MQLFSARAACWLASVKKVTFIMGGRSFSGCLGNRCTFCRCAGSTPNDVTMFLINAMSDRLRSNRFFVASYGAPRTTMERLCSSASFVSVCRVSMWRHTALARPVGEGAGTGFHGCAGAVSPMALTHVSFSVFSAICPTIVEVRMSSFCSIDCTLLFRSSAFVLSGWATHVWQMKLKNGEFRS